MHASVNNFGGIFAIFVKLSVLVLIMLHGLASVFHWQIYYHHGNLHLLSYEIRILMKYVLDVWYYLLKFTSAIPLLTTGHMTNFLRQGPSGPLV